MDWGIDVTHIKLQDVDMPEDLKKMMSRQASAEREKRATITKAEGDKLAALNLSEAARTMATSPGQCSCAHYRHRWSGPHSLEHSHSGHSGRSPRGPAQAGRLRRTLRPQAYSLTGPAGVLSGLDSVW